jgi:hypothetical protein
LIAEYQQYQEAGVEEEDDVEYEGEGDAGDATAGGEEE